MTAERLSVRLARNLNRSNIYILSIKWTTTKLKFNSFSSDARILFREPLDEV